MSQDAASAPPARLAGPPVVQRRLVVFDPVTGHPTVTTEPYIPKQKIQTLALQAISLPYTSAEDELAIELGLPPSDFYGRPLVEVMLLKAALGAARSGDIDQIEKVLDRAIGKPKTSSENLNVNGTYEDFLKAAAELLGARGPQPVETEAVAEPVATQNGPRPVHDAAEAEVVEKDDCFERCSQGLEDLA